MNFLCFEDDELSAMIQAINNLQICFHHKYAPNGKFSVRDLFELQREENDVMILADNNIISPICEIVRNGCLNNQERMVKVALFLTWTKFLNARVTCGLGLLENDTAHLNDRSAEELRHQFLHAVDVIPSQLWKALAFGAIDRIPDAFLYKSKAVPAVDYDSSDDLLYLSNQAAIIKIVQLLKTEGKSGIDLFVDFMNWYADHLDIAESIMVYAAMVFGKVANVALPKGIRSSDFDNTVRGIKNQAWDITYITAWSMLYRNEHDGQVYMFATDDTTQKIITVNILPPGQCAEAVDTIFKTNASLRKLTKLADSKLGKARVRPLADIPQEKKITVIKQLIDEEYRTLRQLYRKEI